MSAAPAVSSRPKTEEPVVTESVDATDDGFTPEQGALLAAVRDEWTAVGFGAGTTDRATAEAGVRLAYQSAELAPPLGSSGSAPRYAGRSRPRCSPTPASSRRPIRSPGRSATSWPRRGSTSPPSCGRRPAHAWLRRRRRGSVRSPGPPWRHHWSGASNWCSSRFATRSSGRQASGLTPSWPGGCGTGPCTPSTASTTPRGSPASTSSGGWHHTPRRSEGWPG